MAQVIAQDSVWYLKTANRDLRTLDLVALSTGKIGIAVGGSTGGSGAIKARMLCATGGLLGTAFKVAAAHAGSEKLADIVATADGGLALSWFNSSHPFARRFDDRGRTLGNDFSLTDTSTTLDLYGNRGLTVVGTNVVGDASGNEFGQTQVLLGQAFGLVRSLAWSGLWHGLDPWTHHHRRGSRQHPERRRPG